MADFYLFCVSSFLLLILYFTCAIIIPSSCVLALQFAHAQLIELKFLKEKKKKDFPISECFSHNVFTIV